MPSESKLNTIRGLLAKAASTEFEAEAEALNERAAALMARHGIEDAQLAASGQEADTIGQLRIDMGEGPYSAERSSLLGVIAHAMRCQCIGYTPRNGRRVLYSLIVGYRSDLDRVELLYTSLLLQATTQVRRVRQEPAPRGQGQSLSAYRRAWFLGFVTSVKHRLEAAETRAAAEAAAADKARRGPSTELVLADRRTAVAAVFADAFPNARQVRYSINSASGYNAGRRAGERADLNQPRVGTKRGALR